TDRHRAHRPRHGPDSAPHRALPRVLAGAPLMPEIRFDRVSRAFVINGIAFQALDDISLTIEDGEFVTIVGPSGCGKSTLLNIAAGLLDADSGETRVGSELVSGPSPSRGVIFQQYALFPWMTVRQNVEFGPKL